MEKLMKKICVIGLGYVGLPLAHAFSSKYEVVGSDINKPRVDEFKKLSDVIVVNRQSDKRSDVKDKVYTRDILGNK